MTIYVATDIHGRGVRHITAFDTKAELFSYAWNEKARSGVNLPKAKHNIDDILHCLYDSGIGFGARNHYRVSRREAHRLARAGAERHCF
jgi:hypothetical protein